MLRLAFDEIHTSAEPSKSPNLTIQNNIVHDIAKASESTRRRKATLIIITPTYL